MKTLCALAHALTPAQRKELGEEVTFLKDLDPELFQQLSNCPGDWLALHELASQLFLLLRNNGYKKVVLPIGSPAFMYTFAEILISGRICNINLKAVFAHSERKSEDILQEDGSVRKVSTFEHQFFF